MSDFKPTNRGRTLLLWRVSPKSLSMVNSEQEIHQPLMWWGHLWGGRDTFSHVVEAELYHYLWRRWGCGCLSCSDWLRSADCWPAPGRSVAAVRLRLLMNTQVSCMTSSTIISVFVRLHHWHNKDGRHESSSKWWPKHLDPPHRCLAIINPAPSLLADGTRVKLKSKNMSNKLSVILGHSYHTGVCSDVLFSDCLVLIIWC